MSTAVPKIRETKFEDVTCQKKRCSWPECHCPKTIPVARFSDVQGPGETVDAGVTPPARVDHLIPEYATPWRFLEGMNQGSAVCAVLDAGGRIMFWIRDAQIAAEIVADRNRTYGSKRR